MPTTSPQQVQRDERIRYLRDVQQLSFKTIGGRLGMSEQGARAGYLRAVAAAVTSRLMLP